MFGLKKKNPASELPDFPPSSAPSMRDYQKTTLPPIEVSQEDSIHGLPSFPDSLMKKGFSQSMIKSAVEDEDKNLPELPEWNEENEVKKPTRAVELDEWTPKTTPKMQQKQTNEDLRSPPPISNQINDKRPLFIKLEKFKEARDSLVKIAEKLNQMDELLKTIKDLKAKEDEEIISWEKDVGNIKSRISSVNREIFENAY
ncbi:hypothetical protein J4423_02645 [Candidatus Pacearchaeota archaeon]|nr:hypothetical protein [Candidatus Pacearchaeota archaeon]